jgi:hypothetical protein
MRNLLSLAAVSIPALSIAAQTCTYATDNLSNSGTCNVIPFGDAVGSATWTNQKYQMLIPAAQLGTVPLVIRELGFASCASGLRSFSSLVITLDHYTGATLGATFAANLSASAVTVMSVKDYVWTNFQDAWNPIGLQRDFVYIPQLGNLVIDIELQGARMSVTGGGDGFHRSTTLQRVYAISWTGSAPLTGSTDSAAQKVQLCTDLAWATPFGVGCQGTNGRTPTLGYTNAPKLGAINFTIDVGSALPSAPVFLIYGTTNAAPTYPIDLTFINMPSCRLYTDAALSFASATNSAGAYSLLVVIPPVPNFVGFRIFNQSFVLDPGAPGLGIAATNAGWFLIGT